MRKVYFDLYNGQVVKPMSSLPAYYALVNWRLKVVELKTCFSQANIDARGELWKQGQLLKLRHDWRNYTLLNKTLKSYLFRSLFSRTSDFETELKPRFLYVSIPGYR